MMIGTCEDCGEDGVVQPRIGLADQFHVQPLGSLICEDCAYEYGEPAEPWRPDPREDGGYFGWDGLRD